MGTLNKGTSVCDVKRLEKAPRGPLRKCPCPSWPLRFSETDISCPLLSSQPWRWDSADLCDR